MRWLGSVVCAAAVGALPAWASPESGAVTIAPALAWDRGAGTPHALVLDDRQAGDAFQPGSRWIQTNDPGTAGIAIAVVLGVGSLIALIAAAAGE